MCPQLWLAAGASHAGGCWLQRPRYEPWPPLCSCHQLWVPDTQPQQLEPPARLLNEVSPVRALPSKLHPGRHLFLRSVSSIVFGLWIYGYRECVCAVLVNILVYAPR